MKNDVKFLSISSQCRALDCARSTLYTWIHEGTWPRPIKLGPRRCANLYTEVSAMIAARVRGDSVAKIKRLVAELEAARADLGLEDAA